MSIRDWASATWAEWTPSWSRGHFEVGPLIILSRRGLGEIAREQFDAGMAAERVDPGRPYLQPKPATVYRLDSVR